MHVRAVVGVIVVAQNRMTKMLGIKKIREDIKKLYELINGKEEFFIWGTWKERINRTKDDIQFLKENIDRIDDTLNSMLSHLDLTIEKVEYKKGYVVKKKKTNDKT